MLLRLILFCVCLHSLIGTPVVINEFVSSNGTVLADEDNDFSDWIELYNFGTEPVQLLGYGLSDSLKHPFKWLFPDVTIDSGGFLLIWASNKNRTDPSGHLHTNFAISATGEPLTLTSPEGELIDFVAPIALSRDEAYARIPDASDTWVRTLTSTPGRKNAGFISGILEPPLISVNSGFYASPLAVSISHPDPEVVLIYSLDGSEPLLERIGGQFYWFKNVFPEQPGDPFGEFLWGVMQSYVYPRENPVVLTKESVSAHLSFRASTNQRSTVSYAPLSAPYTAIVLRTRAVKDGAQASPIRSVTLFLDPPEDIFAGDLAIISIQLDSSSLFDYYSGIYTPGFLFDAWREDFPNDSTFLWSGFGNYFISGSGTEKRAVFEMFDPVGRSVLQRNVGLRLHGGTTRSFPQKSLRLYFGDTYDSLGALDYEIFPGVRSQYSGEVLSRFQRLVLRNSGNDHEGTRIRDAVVGRVLKPLGLAVQAHRPAIHFINGEFWGLINIRERMDRYFIEANFGIPADSVAIIDIGFPDDQLNEGRATDLADFQVLREFFKTKDLSDPLHYAEVGNRMNIDSFLLHHMAQIFIKNTDWPGNNIRVWREPGGLWQYTFHDLDFAMGPFWGLDIDHNTLEFALEEGNDDWPNPDASTLMLRAMLRNELFRARFIQSFADHMSTTFSPERVTAIVEELYTDIAPYLMAHRQRWRNFENLDPSFMVDFALERPSFIRQHILEYFNISGLAAVTIDVSSDAAGTVNVNTLLLQSTQLPFHGLYFTQTPLTLKAVAAEGYEFVSWLVDGDSLNLEAIIPGENTSAVALFRRLVEPDAHPVLHWLHRGIYWSFSYLNHPVLGWLYHLPETPWYSWQPQLGWLYLHAEHQGTGIWLYVFDSHSWLWSPHPELPFYYCLTSRLWQN